MIGFNLVFNVGMAVCMGIITFFLERSYAGTSLFENFSVTVAPFPFPSLLTLNLQTITIS